MIFLLRCKDRFSYCGFCSDRLTSRNLVVYTAKSHHKVRLMSQRLRKRYFGLNCRNLIWPVDHFLGPKLRLLPQNENGLKKTLLSFLDSSSLFHCFLKLKKKNKNLSFSYCLESLRTFHRAKAYQYWSDHYDHHHWCCEMMYNIESHNNLVLKLWHETPFLLHVWKWQCHQFGDHVQRQNLPTRRLNSNRPSSLTKFSLTRLISVSQSCLDRFFLQHASRRKQQECSATNMQTKTKQMKLCLAITCSEI